MSAACTSPYCLYQERPSLEITKDVAPFNFKLLRFLQNKHNEVILYKNKLASFTKESFETIIKISVLHRSTE